MRTQRKGIGRQKGFTLVEMSVVMVVAGLMFAAVSGGQEMVSQAKATTLVNEIEQTKVQLLNYKQANSRFPGDCDADGLIDYAADATSRLDSANSTRAEAYSYSVLLPAIPKSGATSTTQEQACAVMGATGAGTIATLTVSTTNANVWINDLKRAGLVSDSIPNRKLSKLVHDDFMFVGTVEDAGAMSGDAAMYNAIVIHNVPQWMARRLAIAINGQDVTTARSRLRLLARGTTTGTYATSWETGGLLGPEMRDSLVTLVYFFDQMPESSDYGT